MEILPYSSIYRKRWIRYVLHIAFWTCILWFMFLVNSIVFREAVFGKVTVYYSLFTLPLVVSGHYILTKFLINETRIWKFVTGYFSLLFWYLGAILINANLFQWLSASYPENEYLHALSMRYRTLKIFSLFSFQSLHGMFSSIIVYNIIAIGAKIFIDFYKAQLEELRIIEERNRMESVLLQSKLSPRSFLGVLRELLRDLPIEHQAFNAIMRLSELMRFSIKDISRSTIHLIDEVNFLNNYTALERMRHRSDRVSIDFSFDKVENYNLLIKPLLLISFVENAFKHGIGTSKEKVCVAIYLEEQNGVLTFFVINNKPLPIDPLISTKKNGGIGLANVKRRLHLEYPDRHTLTIKETEEQFEVELVLKL